MSRHIHIPSREAVERAAARLWRRGQHTAAMRLLAEAGLGEPARVGFLQRRLGMTEGAAREAIGAPALTH